ncbi:caspase family protein [Actibacterium pelagium]|uniref:Peptidase C14 n=1 Tax=Actibacterium pelagium TaxID=2029103 RepID=A0A917ACS3_9RHOB|nr:caspase domain-containing protein [Actibacterium pelagium]GGE41533.1 peptidase C14 [Actibacterium pelagium]
MKHILFSCFLWLGLAGGTAFAEERIALIVGNGAYQAISPLDNPVSDAALMASTLEAVGFKVTHLADASQAAMKRAVADFGRDLRNAGPETTALFYYAGHAVQSFGNNYLLPVDAQITHQTELDLYGVEADWIVRQLFSARVKTSIVILDACRNNPFENVSGFDSQGLAEMNAPTGSFIAYATSPGNVALDGTQGNSPYTLALADEIARSDQPIEQVSKAVRIRVINQTGGAQTPWDSSSLTSDFYFNRPAPGALDNVAEANLWNSVKNSSDPEQIKLFLRVHPNGSFSGQARALLLAMPTPKPSTGAAPRLAFDAPLPEGDPHIKGKAIAELINGSPLYPPFEGVPEELWKGQKCTNCHQWTRELLCEQGQFYVAGNSDNSLAKLHPYGGTFKSNVRKWASAGCN